MGGGGGGGGRLFVYIYTTEGLAYLPGLGVTHINCSLTHGQGGQVVKLQHQVDRLVARTPRVHGR